MTNTDKNDFNATIGNTVLSAVHLAPYLPYELRFSDGTILYSIDIDNELMLLDTKKGGISNHRIEWGNILPVLRPISSLTIENMKEFSGSDFKRYSIEYLETILETYKKEISTNSLSYRLMQKLFENHFDVFGLIEKGLAVDINTLSVE